MSGIEGAIKFPTAIYKRMSGGIETVKKLNNAFKRWYYEGSYN